jgi:hypothetical protein
MTHPDILAALARERVSTFLSEAQAARQGSLARAAGSQACGKRVMLRDGTKVLIRPVRSGDAPLLVIPPGVPGYDQMPQPVSQPC